MSSSNPPNDNDDTSSTSTMDSIQPLQVTEVKDVDEEDLMPMRDQIDYNQVAGWISHCDADHGSECHESNYSRTGEKASSIYLIDVDQKCIVERKLMDDKFVALSYVWGGVDQLRLLTNNKTQLAIPGALDDDLSSSPRALTTTLHDAINLVSGIGQRYLWVDTLCIIQDDPAHKKSQISQMAAIYGAATLTIVACTAKSAESPLPGVSPGTRMPKLLDTSDVDPKQTFWAENDSLGLLSGVLTRSPHNARAWTCQEVLLSRRCLSMLGSKILFQCQTSRRREDSSKEQTHAAMNQAGNWPPLSSSFPGHSFRYGEMVHDFTRRKLTFPEDRLDAFSGLTTALSIAWNWEFHFALPGDVFAWALLWVPEDPVAVRTKGKETSPVASEYLFPSWSWLSHPGGAYYLLETHPEKVVSYIDNASLTIWDGERTRGFKGNEPSPAASDDDEDSDPVDPLTSIFEGFPPGLMVFLASVATLNHVNPRPPTPAMQAFETQRQEFLQAGQVYTPLINQAGQWHGTLIGITETQLGDLIQDERDEVEVSLVLLSGTVNTWVMGGFTTPIACFDEGEFEGGEWSTLNVMLVSTGERPNRRLAVGEIAAAAWEGLDPRSDLVWLA